MVTSGPRERGNICMSRFESTDYLVVIDRLFKPDSP